MSHSSLKTLIHLNMPSVLKWVKKYRCFINKCKLKGEIRFNTHFLLIHKTQINLSRKTICVRLDGYLVFLTNFTVVV